MSILLRGWPHREVQPADAAPPLESEKTNQSIDYRRSTKTYGLKHILHFFWSFIDEVFFVKFKMCSKILWIKFGNFKIVCYLCGKRTNIAQISRRNFYFLKGNKSQITMDSFPFAIRFMKLPKIRRSFLMRNIGT